MSFTSRSGPDTQPLLVKVLKEPVPAHQKVLS